MSLVDMTFEIQTIVDIAKVIFQVFFYVFSREEKRIMVMKYVVQTSSLFVAVITFYKKKKKQEIRRTKENVKKERILLLAVSINLIRKIKSCPIQHVIIIKYTDFSPDVK